MKISDIMTTNVATLEPQATVMDAAKVMQAHNIGSIPVCNKDHQLLGIVTDRDIIVRNIANDGDPRTTKLDALMTKQVVWAEPDMDINQAIQLMIQTKIRRLPVVKNMKLVGIIALGDLATNIKADQRAGDALSQISTPSRPINMH